MGLAPVEETALAVAIKLNEGTMISSPFFMFKERREACKAAVPELTAIVNFDFVNFETIFSKFWILFPPLKEEDVRYEFLRILEIASYSSLSIDGELMGIFNDNYFKN